MRYGYIPQGSLNGIDFSLPDDPVLNKIVLPGTPAVNARIYIGCGNWGRKEWRGSLYPSKVAVKDFPRYYVQHFNCIEFNATLYRIYPKEKIEEWAAIADGKDFKFCPKLPASVAEYIQGKGSNDTDVFLQSMEGFGAHMGICFLQLGEWAPASAFPSLIKYIENFPRHIKLFIELRHPSWFTSEVTSRLFPFLQQHHTGLVITDTAGRRDVLHMCVTVPHTYIRFVGNRLHESDFRRLQQWGHRLKYWIANGLESVYFILHGEQYSPQLAAYLQQQLS